MFVGKGSIYHSVKRNRWVYEYYVKSLSGKRIRRNISAKTKKILEEKIKNSDLEHVVVTHFGEWADEWLERNIKDDVSAKTYGFYKNLMKYVPDSLRKKPLSKLSSADFTNLIRDARNKKGEKLSVTTARSIRSMMISCLQSAQDNGYISSNVAKLSKKIRKTRTERVALDAEQAKRLIKVANQKDYCMPYKDQDDGQKYFSDEIAVYIELGLNTGLRPGEIFGLRWKCINFTKCKIKVNASLGTHNEDGRFTLGMTKTENSDRTISIDKSMIEILKELKERQNKYSDELGDKFKNSEGLVFTGIYGGPIDLNNFRARQWKKLCAAADMPEKFTPHCLRHTFVTLALLSGMNIKAVSKYVGHSNPSFTMSKYAHVLDEMENEVPVTLGKLLKSDGEK